MLKEVEKIETERNKPKTDRYKYIFFVFFFCGQFSFFSGYGILRQDDTQDWTEY